MKTAGLAFSLMVTSAAATICPEIDLPAPEVVTLMASTTNAETHGWVVAPDCSVETIEVGWDEDGTYGIFCPTYRSIEHVVSIPSDALSINLIGNSLKRGADFSMATYARLLSLSSVPDDPQQLVFPPQLEKIMFGATYAGELTSLDGIRFPDTLTWFVIAYSSITSFKNVQFPAGLYTISIEKTVPNPVIDYNLPPDLKMLYLDGYSMWDFRSLVLPEALQLFNFTGIGEPTRVEGLKWPQTLFWIEFDPTAELETFEIRRSDVGSFEGVESFTANVVQESCESELASLEWVLSVPLCVIPDDVFDTLYDFTPAPLPAPTDEPSSTPAPTSEQTPEPTVTPMPTTTRPSGSRDSSSSGSKSEDVDPDATVGVPSVPPTTKPTTRPASLDVQSTSTAAPPLRRPTPPESYSENALETMLKERAPKTSVNGTKTSGGGSPASRTRYAASNADSSLSSQSPVVSPGDVNAGGSGRSTRDSVIIIVLSSLLSVMVGAAIYHVGVKLNNRRREKNTDVYDAMATPTVALSGSLEPTEEPTTVSATPSAGVELLFVAFRTDKELFRCRIDAVSVDPEPIARGGFGIVYRGSYQGRAVAVKQLPTDAWQGDHATVADFLDEIRLCARLEHHKIVQFVGVSWTDGQQDLAAVSEFMAGGDLHAAIHAHPESTGREWSAPWAVGRLPSKALLALDVAEAVVYLHSFQAPILHRDLKAKNVLLDTGGQAKLSGFGISREMALTTAMTSNVGTAAWIAPEVLRGEQYSDKADIYSLGVLLVELDRCSHPYAHETAVLGGSDATGIEFKNTQIAVLVSTGQLQPLTSTACPPAIHALVSRCVSFDADARPTAMEAFYELRQIHRSNQA